MPVRAGAARKSADARLGNRYQLESLQQLAGIPHDVSGRKRTFVNVRKRPILLKNSQSGGTQEIRKCPHQ
jgi:hypothetical protein